MNEYNEYNIVLVFNVWHERDAGIRSIHSVVRSAISDVGAPRACMRRCLCVCVRVCGSVSLHTGKSFFVVVVQLLDFSCSVDVESEPKLV